MLFRKLLSICINRISNTHRKISISNNQVYVERIRFWQSLKDNDSKCLQILKNGKFAVVNKDRIFVARNSEKIINIQWLSFEEINKACGSHSITMENYFLLNSASESSIPLFGFAASDDADAHLLIEKYNGKFMDVRKALIFLASEQSCLAMQALALIKWHFEHQFCSICGNKSLSNISGSHRKCQSCEKTHFPQMAPVAIVLINNPKTKECLLARQPGYPGGMYTCISGFSEIGESLEDTVQREVAEEVGLEVSDISYMSSQHWSFPLSSLMLACFANIRDRDYKINIDRSELEDARWFSFQQVKEALKNTLKNMNPRQALKNSDEIWIPPEGAIAHELIKKWLFRMNKS